MVRAEGEDRPDVHEGVTGNDTAFERFLNPERVSLPDIDIDFCERRRGEVITYVTEKYGRENVAQIITFGTMKAKAAVRDVGRVMEMPISEVDKVAKLIPNQLEMTLDLALEENPALADLEKRDARVKELLTVARRLEGMTRHASVHAAGVVIAPRPITEFAPLSVKTPDADFAEILSGKTPDLWHSNAPAKGGDTGAMFKKIIERALSMKAPVKEKAAAKTAKPKAKKAAAKK